MRLTLRPIDVWPGELTVNRRISNFSVSYTDTVNLLGREVRALTLGGRSLPDIVVQAAVTEDQLRLDGALRASAQPEHPGVIVSFESKHGPLRYHTDKFTSGYGRTGWHDNLRAIALGLEALRKIDRYGITSAGEQYTGWQAIGPGQDPETLTAEAAARLLLDAAYGSGRWTEIDWTQIFADPDPRAHQLWKVAAKTHHPDAGGDPAVFRRLTEARDLLVGVGAP